MKINFFHFIQDKLLKISEKIADFLVKPMTQVSILVFGCAVAISGAVELVIGSQTTTIECPDKQVSSQFSCSQDVVPQTSSHNNQISVDVAGAINKPGVYELDKESKVADAITAAGGFSKIANRTLIAQKINLAGQLQSSQKIYIPFEEEANLPANILPSEAAEVQQVSKTVNINTASQTVLETLTGVGEATALKIISNRPYASIDELVEKKVLSNSLLEKLGNFIEL